MDLPRYAIIGRCPVKLVRCRDGAIDCLSLDRRTRRFRRNMDFLAAMTLMRGDELQIVSREVFDAVVRDLRREWRRDRPFWVRWLPF